jgi:uncharacterized membrane protein YoaK (UPF0700 family)
LRYPLLKIKMNNPSTEKQNRNNRSSMGLGLAVGVALGVAIGTATHNIGLWLVIGIALGLAIGSGIDKRKTGNPSGGNE